jgi:hypothetical protein
VSRLICEVCPYSINRMYVVPDGQSTISKTVTDQARTLDHPVSPLARVQIQISSATISSVAPPPAPVVKVATDATNTSVAMVNEGTSSKDSMQDFLNQSYFDTPVDHHPEGTASSNAIRGQDLIATEVIKEGGNSATTSTGLDSISVHKAPWTFSQATQPQLSEVRDWRFVPAAPAIVAPRSIVVSASASTSTPNPIIASTTPTPDPASMTPDTPPALSFDTATPAPPESTTSDSSIEVIADSARFLGSLPFKPFGSGGARWRFLAESEKLVKMEPESEKKEEEEREKQCESDESSDLSDLESELSEMEASDGTASIVGEVEEIEKSQVKEKWKKVLVKARAIQPVSTRGKKRIRSEVELMGKESKGGSFMNPATKRTRSERMAMKEAKAKQMEIDGLNKGVGEFGVDVAGDVQSEDDQLVPEPKPCGRPRKRPSGVHASLPIRSTPTPTTTSTQSLSTRPESTQKRVTLFSGGLRRTPAQPQPLRRESNSTQNPPQSRSISPRRSPVASGSGTRSHPTSVSKVGPTDMQPRSKPKLAMVARSVSESNTTADLSTPAIVVERISKSEASTDLSTSAATPAEQPFTSILTTFLKELDGGFDQYSRLLLTLGIDSQVRLEELIHEYDQELMDILVEGLLAGDKEKNLEGMPKMYAHRFKKAMLKLRSG